MSEKKEESKGEIKNEEEENNDKEEEEEEEDDEENEEEKKVEIKVLEEKENNKPIIDENKNDKKDKKEEEIKKENESIPNKDEIFIDNNKGKIQQIKENENIKRNLQIESKNLNINNKESGKIDKEIIKKKRWTKANWRERKNFKKKEIQQIEENKQLINETKISNNEKKEKENLILTEKNTSRPHYIFYFEPHKKISDSNFKNISSMTYHSGQSQPNYKFFCSYGSSKKSELKPKNDYKKEKLKNSPKGITSYYGFNQKNENYISSLRTETKTSKTINIFKPVPKTAIQTLKYDSKFKQNKKEEKTKGNNFDYRQNYNTYINIKKNENINNKQPKYFAKCPHCHYVLNDENEVRKYYINLQNKDK